MALQRPGWVTFAAVMQFVSGGFLLLVGLLLMLGGSFLAAIFEEGLGELGDLLGAFFLVIGIVVLAIGVLAIFVGIGVLKGQGWARITAIVLTILGALASVDSLLNGDYMSIVWLALDGLVLFALFNPVSKQWFDQMAPRPMATGAP
jgi:hypothetical protein